MRTIREFEIPLTVSGCKARKKEVSLRYNVWITYSYHARNKAKTAFSAQWVGIQFPKWKSVILRFTLCVHSTKKRRDLHGMLSILDKLFTDVLVERGGIKDDDLNYVSATLYDYRIVAECKKPKVIVTVEGILDDETN